jgi:fluoride exporter
VERRTLAAVAVGGAVGALLRAALLEAIPPEPGAWPWATFAANVAGAGMLGLVARRLGGAPYALLGPGLCGALTTFSTLQLELYELLDGGNAALAGAYVAASLAAGLAAVAAGDRLGRA